MSKRKAFGFFILGASVTMCVILMGFDNVYSMLHSNVRVNDWRFGEYLNVHQRLDEPVPQTTPPHFTIDHVPNGIHILMVFPMLKSNASKRQGYNISDLDLLQRRENEFIDTLKHNSNMNIVTKIYLLNEQPEVLRSQLSKAPDLDMRMIETVQSSDNPSYMEVFQFVSTNLQNKLVFILNADNSLGRGFDQLNLTWWQRSPKVMYALTRHTPLNSCKLGPIGYCDPNGTYIGSHDGFLFYINKPLPYSFLQELDFPSNVYGSENVIIWAFRKFLKFNVSNPCKRLYLRHNHCSNLRPHFGRIRVNTNGRSGTIAFSS